MYTCREALGIVDGFRAERTGLLLRPYFDSHGVSRGEETLLLAPDRPLTGPLPPGLPPCLSLSCPLVWGRAHKDIVVL